MVHNHLTANRNRVLRELVKNSPIRATGAHVSIIGHTTPEDLRAYLTDLDIANGTGNRFLFILSERVRSLPNPPRLSDATRQQLTERVRVILRHATRIGMVRRTSRAARMWEELYEELSRSRPGLVGTLLARGPAHVTRLSTLFALLDLAREVDVRHLASAAAWWDFSAQSVEIIFAGRTGSDAADRIKAEMLPGETLTISEIRQTIFSNHVGSGTLRDALALLEQLGEVHLSTSEATGGRPALVVKRLDPTAAKERAA